MDEVGNFISSSEGIMAVARINSLFPPFFFFVFSPLDLNCVSWLNSTEVSFLFLSVEG